MRSCDDLFVSNDYLHLDYSINAQDQHDAENLELKLVTGKEFERSPRGTIPEKVSFVSLEQVQTNPNISHPHQFTVNKKARNKFPKRASHIESEKRRRKNIKEAYEQLSALISFEGFHGARTKPKIYNAMLVIVSPQPRVNCLMDAFSEMNGIDLLALACDSTSELSPCSSVEFRLSTSSNSTRPASPGQLGPHNRKENESFLSRVATYPLVHSISQFYNQSKNNSAFVKYGAERVESGMKYVCQPVLKTIGTSNLDSFACKQLDKSVELFRVLDYLQESQDTINNNIVALRSAFSDAQISIKTTFDEWTDAFIQANKEFFAGVHQITNRMKQEIVQTLSKVLEMLSSCSSFLPQTVNSMIRSFVLSLPGRWSAITSESYDESNNSKRFVKHSHQIIALANESLILLQSLFRLINSAIPQPQQMHTKQN
ncbi:hypothetical protein O9G_001756 [Rozella allomycis CSF55]|uniref:BHLH domain-containing protein n=1 Tax=Rozella allomycis (strain CSF55) TaxID=988480 RepID=A0A075AXR0_ROZAC|nr:hypothetical protein O9G_001756 [Rozella allomycis CSF55]|eukprot:EPZ33344.1 hypothetical protein O9G_001756 [Rozella allomycis CSF55]